MTKREQDRIDWVVNAAKRCALNTSGVARRIDRFLNEPEETVGTNELMEALRLLEAATDAAYQASLYLGRAAGWDNY